MGKSSTQHVDVQVPVISLTLSSDNMSTDVEENKTIHHTLHKKLKEELLTDCQLTAIPNKHDHQKSQPGRNINP